MQVGVVHICQRLCANCQNCPIDCSRQPTYPSCRKFFHTSRQSPPPPPLPASLPGKTTALLVQRGHDFMLFPSLVGMSLHVNKLCPIQLDYEAAAAK